MNRLYDELLGQWNRLLGQVIECEGAADRTKSTFARRVLAERAAELRSEMDRVDALMQNIRDQWRAERDEMAEIEENRRVGI